MKTLEKIGVAIILLVALLILTSFLFIERETNEQHQLDEMVNYQRSEGRDAVIEDGYLLIK